MDEKGEVDNNVITGAKLRAGRAQEDRKVESKLTHAVHKSETAKRGGKVQDRSLLERTTIEKNTTEQEWKRDDAISQTRDVSMTRLRQ